MRTKVTKEQLQIDIGIVNDLYRRACCGGRLYDYENRSIKRVMDDLVEIYNELKKEDEN